VYKLIKSKDEREAIKNLVQIRFSRANSLHQSPSHSQEDDNEKIVMIDTTRHKSQARPDHYLCEECGSLLTSDNHLKYCGAGQE